MWNYETSLMAGGCMIALAWAYALRKHSHIRIDVIYSHLSPRVRAGIDVFGSLLLFFPLIFLFAVSSIMWAKDSWATGEVSIQTYWYPPLAPFRTVVAVGFLLLALQGTAQFIRDLYLLVRNKVYD
jgi:TRAP-type mannitol/chloroaromatic compound transport system permease small subunit